MVETNKGDEGDEAELEIKKRRNMKGKGVFPRFSAVLRML
jgi:hypothetical protein